MFWKIKRYIAICMYLDVSVLIYRALASPTVKLITEWEVLISIRFWYSVIDISASFSFGNTMAWIATSVTIYLLKFFS